MLDGDDATITLATAEHDPLQVCVAAMVSAYVNDRWVVRRLPAMVEHAGYVDAGLASYGFVQIADVDSMVSIADRGADTLAADGRVGRPLADALEAEVRRPLWCVWTRTAPPGDVDRRGCESCAVGAGQVAAMPAAPAGSPGKVPTGSSVPSWLIAQAPTVPLPMRA